MKRQRLSTKKFNPQHQRRKAAAVRKEEARVTTGLGFDAVAASRGRARKRRIAAAAAKMPKIETAFTLTGVDEALEALKGVKALAVSA